MGYKFELKETGDSVSRGFSEPVDADSSVSTKCPCKKKTMIMIGLVSAICASIAIGVGIHVMELNMKKNSTELETTSPVNNTSPGTATSPATDVELPTPTICPWLQEDSPILLISIGGFRSDYLSRNITPAINNIARLGVRATNMISVNPTLTMPNLNSIITGLYPESHGIIHDTFNGHSSWKNSKSINDQWKGEPIWVTLGQQNKTTAAIDWPGTEANLEGYKPIVYKTNKSQNALTEPIEQIFSWLDLSPNQRPSLILWYIDHAVKTTQTYGPHSPLVDDKLVEIDGAIRDLRTGLEQKFLTQCVNLIIVSDHGMSVTSSERIFNFHPFVPSLKWTVFGETYSLVHAKKNVTAKDIEDLASSLECRNQNVKVFTKSSAPTRYHVFNFPTSSHIFMQANDRWLSSRSKYTKHLGSSGYENRLSSMRAIFMAIGPGFRDHLLIEPFENIELYNMMSELLKVKPAKNNGTSGSLNHIIRTNEPFQPKFKVSIQSCEKPENWKLVKTYLDKTHCFKENVTRFILAKLREAVKNKADVLKKHVPIGPPVEVGSKNCYKLIYQTDFVVGTRNGHPMPFWSSTTLDGQTKWMNQRSWPSTHAQNECTFTDARLSIDNWINGFQQNQDIGFLYNLDLLDPPEKFLSSNAVPMYNEFRNGIWKFLWQTLKQYSQSETVNVIVGPVFDNDHDGIADNFNNSISSKVPVPSHFFVVLSKCRDKQDTNLTECLINDKLDVLSFVLPHRRKIDNCMNNADFLEEHIVRIRDIEILTGLVFFERYQDHLSAVRRRVFLPGSLWPSFNTEAWLKQPCSSLHRSSCHRDPAVLLISLSGFSPSHFALSRTPVLDKIRSCGIQSRHMRPVYPSNTFSNTYSIVTGLYPESHGMISKYMYDPVSNRTFDIKEKLAENQTWWGGEPIWVTAEKQNKSTAAYFWPGSEASVQGIKPSKWIPYDRQIGFKKRIQTILDWLSLPGKERPDFIFTNFEEPDLTSHIYGVNSHRIENALTSIDDLMGQLMNGIKERNLQDCVNLIVVSDHGMQSSSQRQVIDLKNLNSNFFITEGATVFQRPGVQNATVDNNLKTIHCTGAHIRSYTKDTLPRRLHFTNSKRIGDFILTLDDGWVIKTKSKLPKSVHGYDNRFDSMQAIFLAVGPSFQNSTTIESFENIEIYNMLTELLHIQPSKNNGTEGRLNNLLKDSRTVLQPPPTKYPSCCSKKSMTKDECAYSESIQKDPTKTPNLPFSVPNYQTTGNFCILHTDAFSQAESNDYHLPLWFSYNLLQNKSNNVMNYTPSGCSSFEDKNLDITTGSLFLTGEQYNYLPSTVPMYKSFKKGVWQELSKLVHEYAVKYSRLNIVSGPIFEDGLQSAKRFKDVNCNVPIPTHFYVILTKFCSSKDANSCNEAPVDVLSFILPHVGKDQNCLKPKDYLFDHTARIKDIEEQTGLTFMTGLPWEKSVIIRTYLPLKMWEGLHPSTWMNLPQCINLDKACKKANRPVLLISLDGFRADYTKYNVTPVINRLRHCGVETPFMRSSFPSKTFPNHYTIVTGLYPESHGILGNFMYDMSKNKTFTMATLDPYWWGGETIWKTMTKAGRESASYFFVGSSISGQNATHFYPYSGKTSFEKRIDQTVAWLKQDIPLVSLYFDEPDLMGHREGPSSKQIINTLRLVDSYIGQLMNKLYEEDLHNCVNIIIVADHGMADISCERSIVFWDIIDKETATKDMYLYKYGQISNKYWQDKKVIKKFPEGEYPISISELMSKLECSSPHLRVYQKEFLPKRLHYTNNKRLGDIQLLVDDTWYLHRKSLYCRGGGTHGYDNRFKSMNALFLAHGPDFKQQLDAEPFDNIEVYNLLTDMLNITGAPNNGTEGRLHGLLRRPPQEPSRQSIGQYEHVFFKMTLDELDIFLRDHKCLNFTPTHEGVSLLYVSLVKSKRLTSQEKISFGLPLLKKNISIQLLRHNSYLTAYDSSRSRPLFIVATRTAAQQPLVFKSKIENGCMRDPRMPLDQLKPDETENDNEWLNLAPTDFASHEDEVTSYLSTNFIRVSRAFKEALWNEALKVLQEWRTRFATSSWFVGPVYDYNVDGLADNDDTIKRFSNDSLPTHVFLVIVAFRESGEIEATTAYILPSNQHHFPKCRGIPELLRDHQARVRDVELLTNLEFFPKEKFSRAVIHRTSMTDFERFHKTRVPHFA